MRCSCSPNLAAAPRRVCSIVISCVPPSSSAYVKRPVASSTEMWLLSRLEPQATDYSVSQQTLQFALEKM